MSKIKKKNIVLFLGAIAILYTVIYIVPKVTGALISSYTVEYGELKLSDETKAYFVRNEKVYVTESGGRTNYYIDEGTMVRKGTSVMEVTGGSDSEPSKEFADLVSKLKDSQVKTGDFQTQSSGIISYYTDGYEHKLTSETMGKLDLADYEKITNDRVLELNRADIAKGEPVFKVVDRAHWYMVCFIDKKHADRYKEGSKISVEFKDSTIEASVYNVKDMDGKTRVILTTNNYYNKFTQSRVEDVTLTTAQQSGLLILNSSIGKEKGQLGVYVKNKAGDYVFKPIQVLLTDGENSVIKKSYFYDDKGTYQKTVETYDDVLKDAE